MTERTEIRCAIELRADDSRMSPGRIVGTLLTYGQRAQDRAERFAAGSLSWDPEGVILNIQHRRDSPVARFTPIEDRGSLTVDLALPDTTWGRDAATMIRNQTLRGLSVEFAAQRAAQVEGVREIRKARLVGAAIVDDPSYPTRVEVRRVRRRLPLWL